MEELQKRAAPPYTADEERRQRLKAGEQAGRAPSALQVKPPAPVRTARHRLPPTRAAIAPGRQLRQPQRSAARHAYPPPSAARRLPNPAFRPPRPCPTAGEAYFAKVLNSSKTKDLLGAAKSAAAGAAPGLAPAAPLLPGGGAAAGAAPRLPLTTFDEDFLQAGAVIEGARTYVLGILFVAAQAAQLVFLKVCGCSSFASAAGGSCWRAAAPACRCCGAGCGDLSGKCLLSAVHPTHGCMPCTPRLPPRHLRTLATIDLPSPRPLPLTARSPPSMPCTPPRSCCSCTSCPRPSRCGCWACRECWTSAR